MFKLNTDSILKIVEWLLKKLAQEISDLAVAAEKYHKEVVAAETKLEAAHNAAIRANALRTKLGKLLD